PACKQGLLVPLQDPEAIDLVEDEPPKRAREPAPLPPQPRWRPPLSYASAPETQKQSPTPPLAPPERLRKTERSWRGYVFWLLLAAMIPLAMETFVPREDAEARFERTLKKHPELHPVVDDGDEAAADEPA